MGQALLVLLVLNICLKIFGKEHPHFALSLNNLAGLYKDMSFLRLTVDEQKDFELIKYIIEELYPTNPNYTLSDILNLYDKNPEIFKINSNVKQTFSS